MNCFANDDADSPLTTAFDHQHREFEARSAWIVKCFEKVLIAWVKPGRPDSNSKQFHITIPAHFPDGKNQ
jgi:hypothetical protein